MSFLSDVKLALRLLVRAPLFALTLLGVLGAGIGATTAMFSITESLLLRPLPYDHAEELMTVYKTHELLAETTWPTSYPDFKDWASENKTFTSLAAIEGHGLSVAMPGKTAVPVGAAAVSGTFFDILALRPLQGRLLGPDDDRADAAPVCVISASLWRRNLGGDPSIIGTTLTLNSIPYTVVGIAPEGFRFSSPHNTSDVWTSLARDFAGREGTLDRDSNFLRVIGRRRPGVTAAAANADLSAVAASLAQRYPKENAHRGTNAVDLHEAVVGDTKETVLILFGAVLLLFVVVCANVASLLLARGATRRAEMAARAALGATRGRLIAQLVTESVVTFLLAGAAGAALSVVLVDVFAKKLVDGDFPVHLDAFALAFALGSALLCGVLFGLVPALATSRVEPYAVLKETSAQAGVNKTQRAVRGGLVVAQVAVAFALLVASGIAVRGLQRTAATPPGFDPDNLALAKLSLPHVHYDDRAKQTAFYDDLIRKVTALPGVDSAGFNSTIPMGGSNSNGWFKIEGRPPWAPNEGPLLERNYISPRYFETMRIPILRGRAFNEGDRADSRKVVIISHSVAERFFPDQDPIGLRIDLDDSPGDQDWREIVGIAGDVRKFGLTVAPLAEAYVPLTQSDETYVALAVRSNRGDAIFNDLRLVVGQIDREVAPASLHSMNELIGYTLEQERVLALLLGIFAIAGLVLSTLGLFGLVSYTTSQRTRELGLRMALGSSPGSVIALVVRGGARLVGLGLGVGLVGAILVARAVAAHVEGATRFDPLVFAVIPVVLGVAGLASCVLPAWRAARIPPSSALRYE